MKRSIRATGTITAWSRAAATVAVVLLAATACGGDEDTGAGSDISAEEMAAIFVDSGAPADEAECVGEQLEGKLTKAEVEQFVASTDGSDVPEEVIEAIGAALGECSVG